MIGVRSARNALVQMAHFPRSLEKPCFACQAEPRMPCCFVSPVIISGKVIRKYRMTPHAGRVIESEFEAFTFHKNGQGWKVGRIHTRVQGKEGP